MAQTVSLANTFGRGQQLRSNLATAEQNREFNSLRATGERQRQDLQQRTFDADTQRANSEKLLQGFQIMRNNPGSTPDVLEELGNNGIINRGAIPDMLREATTSPQTFQQKMADAESKIRLQLGQARPQPTFGAPVAGVGEEGPEFRRFAPSGESRAVEGFAPPSGASAAGAAERFFNSLAADLTPEQRADAELIQLGLQARAGTTSATERIATDPELTEDVAESQATIAQRRKFGEATGASRSKLIDKGFESIQSINTNIRNMDKAVAAIDAGASTGVIESRFFPTFRESTLRLEQVQKELGLDVVGGVTFGALSKGELDLALAVALNTGLEPPALKQFLVDKKAAQEKLRAYFSEQIDFLDQGGTIAGFLRQKQRNTGDGNSQQLIDQAERAIQSGADPQAVLQRLTDLGVDTSGL